MKLYQTPGGTWAGSHKAWEDAIKAEGLNPKQQECVQVEVPTAKPALMEWLTFHNVNVANPASPVSAPAAAAPAATTVPGDLDALFEAAPLRHQLDLAVAAIDRANTRIGG